MSTWTYSRYRSGHGRQLPEGARINPEDETDDYELGVVAEACAQDDHSNHDGWEGDRTERDIYLFRDGELHSHFVVTVEYEPTFSAQRVAAAS